MADVSRTVQAVYTVKDQATKPISGIAAAADKAGRSSGMLTTALGGIGGAGRGISGVIGNVAALGLAINTASMFGRAFGRIVGFAFNDVQQKAESTQLAIAGSFKAYGMVDTFQEGQKAASYAFKQIRADAAALPGEAEDYIDVFRTGLPAIAATGISDLSRMMAMSNRYSAVAIANQVDAAQAGRDMYLMLKGHAGAHVKTWTVLQALIGKSAEQFNKMTALDRFKAVEGVLGKYQEMLDAYNHSWEAQKGTLVSYVKQFTMAATKPMFEAASRSLERMNNWLGANQARIEKISEIWGKKVYGQIERVEKLAMRVYGWFDRAAKAMAAAGGARTAAGGAAGMAAAAGSVRGAAAGVGGAVALAGMGAAVISGIGAILAPLGPAIGAGIAALFSAVAVGPIVGMLAPLFLAMGGAMIGPALVGGALVFMQNTAAMAATMGSLSAAAGNLMAAFGPVTMAVDALSQMFGGVFVAMIPQIADGLASLSGGISFLISAFSFVVKDIATTIAPYLSLFGAAVGRIFKNVSDFLEPMIKILGVALMGLWQVFKYSVLPILGAFVGAFTAIITFISEILGKLGRGIDGLLPKLGVGVAKTAGADFFAPQQSFMDQFGKFVSDLPEKTPTLSPTTAPPMDAKAHGAKTYNDFRNSRFDIKQAFAEGFDMDRIASAFSSDLAKLAEHSVQSGLSGTYSRVGS